MVLRPNADATSEQPGMVVVCVCDNFKFSDHTAENQRVSKKGRINRFSQTNFKKWIDNNIPGMR